MKKITLFAIIILFTSCVSQRNFNSFYNSYSTAPNTMSFQAPMFLKGLISLENDEFANILNHISSLKVLNIHEHQDRDLESVKNNLFGALKQDNFNTILHFNENGRDFNIFKKEGFNKSYLVFSIENDEKLLIVNAKTSLKEKELLQLLKNLKKETE